ncbi:hypothetical protein [Rubinisphaera sp. JC750]|uniref:DUF7684 family protein n=1 Tax=Rubinisphaera sp. JC750 TaxID=2898658 RepID=UPI001F20B513|nr:hypothetical protein [Rubinisphaera sp. JC750]
MRRISNATDFDLWLSQLDSPFKFSSPFSGHEFTVMIVAADANISHIDRNSLSKQLVSQGCRYAVCTGYDCSKWDDSIDTAFLETDPEFSPPDEKLVMTTWHENESLGDVALFFRNNTSFDSFRAQHFLALILGGDETMCDAIHSALRSSFR